MPEEWWFILPALEHTMTTQAADFILQHAAAYEEKARELFCHHGDARGGYCTITPVEYELQIMQADGLLTSEEVRAIRWCVERIGEVADFLESLARDFARYQALEMLKDCLLYTSPSPRDQRGSRMPSSA